MEQNPKVIKRFEKWANIYYPYLMEMKRLVESNFHKELKEGKLDTNKFFIFIYNHSTQYISQYEQRYEYFQ